MHVWGQVGRSRRCAACEGPRFPRTDSWHSWLVGGRARFKRSVSRDIRWPCGNRGQQNLGKKVDGERRGGRPLAPGGVPCHSLPLPATPCPALSCPEGAFNGCFQGGCPHPPLPADSQAVLPRVHAADGLHNRQATCSGFKLLWADGFLCETFGSPSWRWRLDDANRHQ